FVLSTQHGTLKRLFLALGRGKKEYKRALVDLSLAVRPGEAVALIGRNGSGKSTFLSLVGGIYKPSSGELVARDSVAPLLELGAGFHHELTGRQNIFLNGVILGLTR